MPSAIQPSGPRSAAFRAFAALLQSSPTLRRVVKTWRTWDGTPNESADPTAAECPWVRLTPSPMHQTRLALGTAGATASDSPIVVTIETAVAGTNVDDSMNLADAIHRVISGQEPGASAAFANAAASLKAAGVRDIEFEAVPWVANTGGTLAVAKGHAVLIQNLPT
jgi:hypothetical protein